MRQYAGVAPPDDLRTASAPLAVSDAPSPSVAHNAWVAVVEARARAPDLGADCFQGLNVWRQEEAVAINDAVWLSG
jgi:hypothetical protein